MRQISGRDTHADVVNRRSRIALVAVLVLTAVFAAANETAPDPEPGPVGGPAAFDFVAAGVSADLPVSNAGAIRDVEPPRNEAPIFDVGVVAPLDPIVAFVDDAEDRAEGGAAEDVPTTTVVITTTPPTTTAPPPPTTTTPPPTTTVPPPAVTVSPPPTTTVPQPTTTLPPPTTTLPPPPTTEPPPTTTEPPSDLAFYAIVSADVSCDDAEVTWKVTNPKEDWNKGWTMVIDGDSRGVFDSGETVKRGKTEKADEVVDSGSHTLSVTVRWVHGGEPDSGHGTYSTTVSADCDDDDD